MLQAVDSFYQDLARELDPHGTLQAGDYVPVVETKRPDGYIDLELHSPYGGTPLEFSLQPKQAIAWESDADEVLFGGAAGGGKSFFLRVLSIAYCVLVPGVQVYLFRRLSPDLQKNHMEGPTSYPQLLAPWTSGGQAQILYSGPGAIKIGSSRIHLSHLQRESSLNKYYGPEMHVLLIDELTTFTAKMYKFLRGRVRLSGLDVPNGVVLPRIVAASNPGGIGHCLPPDTEVLTPEGWRDLPSIAKGERVATLDRDEHLVFAPVEQVHQHWYSGDMFVFDSPTTYIQCTPNHQLCRKTETKTPAGRTFHPISQIQVKDLPSVTRFIKHAEGWQGKKIDVVRLKPHYRSRRDRFAGRQPLEIPGDEYCELVGWMVSEGWTLIDGATSKFGVAQQKTKNRDIIRDLLNRCGFTFNETRNGFNVGSKEWTQHFREACGHHCRDKRIPRRVLDSTTEQLGLMHNAAMLGDGSGHIYYTTSRRLASQMSEVALKLGYSPNIMTQDRNNRIGLSYMVAFRIGRLGWLERDKAYYQTYNGRVYCLGIPELHRFFVRQNGQVWLSGNSYVKSMFVDPAPPFEIHRVETSEGGMRRQFIPALLEDNPALHEIDPDYENRLEGLGHADLVQALRYGSWDIEAGGMFDDLFDRDIHVIEPFEIPSSWYIDRSFDWGSTRPFSTGWWAESDGTEATLRDGSKRKWPKGTLFRIQEDYGWNGNENEGLKLVSSEIARRIIEREKNFPWGKRVRPGPADPAIYTQTDGRSTADDMEQVGVRWVRGDASPGSRKTGAEALRTRLKAAIPPDDARPGWMPEDPAIYIFSHCRQWIRTVPRLPRDEKDPDKVDKNAEDHIFDDTKYRCLHKRMVTSASYLR